MIKPSFLDRSGVARCPICGNGFSFVLLAVTFHVYPVNQTAAGRWKALRPTPKKFEPTIPLILICDSCAHPLGAPTQELLRRLPKPARRKPLKKR